MQMKLSKIVLESDTRIRIKNLHVDSMEITEKGIELEFRGADGKHKGDLIIKPGKLIWNKGQTSKYGKAVSWTELLKLINEKGIMSK